MYQSLVGTTLDFVNKGKRYDLKINPEELFKAGRLLWTIIAMEVQFNVPLKMTDSIFGYNMLYPYTDDFVDCTSVSQKSKKEFAEVFHERLLIGESNYDPKSHFNGQQSNVAELRLPSSLQPYADKIVKVFDMVKFIENDWTRHGEHKCVYMSLAAIHDAQIKSTLQHARHDDGYAPTMAQIEQVSAEKGGASLIAAGFLIEGRLTRAKMAYLEYLGFGMQLVDDLQVSSSKSCFYISSELKSCCHILIYRLFLIRVLILTSVSFENTDYDNVLYILSENRPTSTYFLAQDVELDMKNNHRTIFTQSIAEGKTLDVPTARLIQYCFRAHAYEKFVVDNLTYSDEKTDVMQPHYAYLLLVKACIMLILEAVSRLPQYFSIEFYRELSTFSLLPFNSLRRLRIEDKLMTIVRNQWF
jgi:hypothetical protein